MIECKRQQLERIDGTTTKIVPSELPRIMAFCDVADCAWRVQVYESDGHTFMDRTKVIGHCAIESPERQDQRREAAQHWLAVLRRGVLSPSQSARRRGI